MDKRVTFTVSWNTRHKTTGVLLQFEKCALQITLCGTNERREREADIAAGAQHVIFYILLTVHLGKNSC